MTIREGVSRARLQISLKPSGLIGALEADEQFYFPRSMLLGRRTSPCIVFGEASFEIRSVSDVALSTMAEALEDVGVVHVFLLTFMEVFIQRNACPKENAKNLSPAMTSEKGQRARSQEKGLPSIAPLGWRRSG